jgi:hypothetical protein
MRRILVSAMDGLHCNSFGQWLTSYGSIPCLRSRSRFLRLFFGMSEKSQRTGGTGGLSEMR